jgi:hypothetical protein
MAESRVLMLAAQVAHDIPSTRWISLTKAICFFAKLRKNGEEGVMPYVPIVVKI